MIEALKSDEIVNKVGGRFKLTALIQKHDRISWTAPDPWSNAPAT